MPTPKKTTTPPKPKPTTVKMPALVRVDDLGAYHLVGYGDNAGMEINLETLRADLDEYGRSMRYEEYLIEIEVPAYSGFATQPRFKMKAA